MPTQTQKYKYINTLGKEAYVDAADSASALKSASNRMANSGVQLVTAPGANQGATSFAPPGSSSNAKNDYISNVAGSSTTDPMSRYTSAFESYIESLKPSKEIQTARTSLADIQSDIFGKNLASRREYEQLLDMPGGTTAGAREAARMASRRSGTELADLAVRENAAANTLRALQEGQGSVSDIANTRLAYEKLLLENQAEDPEGFNLSEGQSRYEYNPKTGTYEEIASVPKTYAPKTGSSARIIGGADSGYFVVNDDGTISPMKLRPEVSWEDYLAAAQAELGMNINPDSATYKQLRAQYDQEYPTDYQGDNDIQAILDALEE